MSRFLKKFAGIILSVSLMTSCFTITYAASEPSKQNISDICKQYNLQTVESVPDGVVPIECKNVDELKAVIERNENSFKNDSKVQLSSFESNNTVSLTSSDDYYNNLLLYANYDNGINSIVLNATCLVHHFTYSPYVKILSCSASTSLQGYSLGYEWVPNPCTTYISPDGLYVAAYGSGTFKCYLVIEGGILLWSKPISLSDSFQF